MVVVAEQRDFWDDVEHEFQVRKPFTWRITMLMLRAGIMAVLFTAVYLFLAYLLEPSRGYFFSRAEILVHPILWALFGVLLIVSGAYLRFRTIGPIMDRLKADNRTY